MKLALRFSEYASVSIQVPKKGFEDPNSTFPLHRKCRLPMMQSLNDTKLGQRVVIRHGDRCDAESEKQSLSPPVLVL